MDSGSTIFSSGNWSKEGMVAEITPPGGVFRFPPDGGAPSQLTVLDKARGELRHSFPQILPGGKAVLFTVDGNVEVVSIADRRRKIVSAGSFFGRYLPTGHLVVLSQGTLFAVPFDVDRLEARGTPTPVVSQISGGLAQPVDFSTSAPEEGMAVYRSGGVSGIGTVQSIDSSGNRRQVLSKPDAYTFLRYSPDGRQLTLMLRSDLYVYDLRREIMTRLTFTGKAANTPVWTPDGRYIVFRAPGTAGMAWVRADGGGTPQPLIPSGNGQFPGSFTAGGERLVYCEFRSGGFDVLTVPIQEERDELRAGQPEVFLDSRFNERDPTFSPDGKWVAYHSDESGPFEIYVQSFPDRGAKVQISAGGGWHATWSRNAKELFFLNPQGRLMVASFAMNGSTFTAGKPRLWSNTPVAYGDINSRHYDVAPDGKHVVALVPVDAGNFSDNHVTFLLNFFDELRRRAPVGK